MSKFDGSKLKRMNPNSKQYQDQCNRIDYGKARMAMKESLKEDKNTPDDSMDDAAVIRQKEQQDRRNLRRYFTLFSAARMMNNEV